MRRVLTLDGRVAISVWQKLGRHPLYEALFGATARHLGIPISIIDISFSLGDAEELRAFLENAGFQRITVTPQSLEIRLPSPELFVPCPKPDPAPFQNHRFSPNTVHFGWLEG
jgi:hypothetical protein